MALEEKDDDNASVWARVPGMGVPILVMRERIGERGALCISGKNRIWGVWGLEQRSTKTPLRPFSSDFVPLP